MSNKDRQRQKSYHDVSKILSDENIKTTDLKKDLFEDFLNTCLLKRIRAALKKR